MLTYADRYGFCEQRVSGAGEVDRRLTILVVRLELRRELLKGVEGEGEGKRERERDRERERETSRPAASSPRLCFVVRQQLRRELLKGVYIHYW